MIESMKTGTKFAIGAAIVVVTAGWLMATGIKQSGQYFLTPTELSRKVATDPGFYDVGMKVGAHVVPGSVVREVATSTLKFSVADGGATSNRQLMQLQADTSGRTVLRATARDLSALGAAQLAGVAVGLWSHEDVEKQARDRDQFDPVEDEAARKQRQAIWHDAVARARFRPASTH